MNKIVNIVIFSILSTYLHSSSIYRGNNSHHSYYGNKEIRGEGLEWEFKASHNRIDIAPLFDSNSVYLATKDGYIYSIDKNTGSKNWSIDINKEPSSQLYMHRETLIFGDIEGSIYAINTNDKSMTVINTVNQRTIMNPIQVDEIIYTFHDNGYICATDINFKDSAECYATDSFFFAGPVFEENKLILFGLTQCCGKEIYSFSIENEIKTENIYTLDPYIFLQMPILVNDKIYASELSTSSNSSPFIYYIDTNDGNINKLFEVDTYAWLSYWNDRIVFSDNNNFYSIDLNGNLIWKFETDIPVATYPSLTNNNAYLSNLNRVISLDFHTGFFNWDFEGEFVISTPLVIDDGRIFFGTRDGRLLSLQ